MYSSEYLKCSKCRRSFFLLYRRTKIHIEWKFEFYMCFHQRDVDILVAPTNGKIQCIRLEVDPGCSVGNM